MIVKRLLELMLNSVTLLSRNISMTLPYVISSVLLLPLSRLSDAKISPAIRTTYRIIVFVFPFMSSLSSEG